VLRGAVDGSRDTLGGMTASSIFQPEADRHIRAIFLAASTGDTSSAVCFHCIAAERLCVLEPGSRAGDGKLAGYCHPASCLRAKRIMRTPTHMCMRASSLCRITRCSAQFRGAGKSV